MCGDSESRRIIYYINIFIMYNMTISTYIYIIIKYWRYPSALFKLTVTVCENAKIATVVLRMYYV